MSFGLKRYFSTQDPETGDVYVGYFVKSINSFSVCINASKIYKTECEQYYLRGKISCGNDAARIPRTHSVVSDFVPITSLNDDRIKRLIDSIYEETKCNTVRDLSALSDMVDGYVNDSKADLIEDYEMDFPTTDDNLSACCIRSMKWDTMNVFKNLK